MSHGLWKCEDTLIKHPERTQTIHHGDEEFPTMDFANDYALQEARDAIDRNSEGEPTKGSAYQALPRITWKRGSGICESIRFSCGGPAPRSP